MFLMPWRLFNLNQISHFTMTLFLSVETHKIPTDTVMFEAGDKLYSGSKGALESTHGRLEKSAFNPINPQAKACLCPYRNRHKKEINNLANLSLMFVCCTMTKLLSSKITKSLWYLQGASIFILIQKCRLAVFLLSSSDRVTTCPVSAVTLAYNSKYTLSMRATF